MTVARDFQLENVLQAALNSGHAVWVVGDIHGYFETFLALLDKLNLKEGDHVVCLGDIIDRGPNSAGVLKLVSESSHIHSIRGNHEESMRLSFTPKYRGKMKKSWLKYGGLQTLESIDDDVDIQHQKANGFLHQLESLPVEIILEEFRLVHAGYNLSKPLDQQNNHDRLWSRGIFKADFIPDDCRQIIVGHTPVQEIEGEPTNDIWKSKLNLKSAMPCILGIDLGIYLPNSRNPRLASININGGRIIIQSRVENIEWVK